jgi:hypothetical protein
MQNVSATPLTGNGYNIAIGASALTCRYRKPRSG